MHVQYNECDCAVESRYLMLLTIRRLNRNNTYDGGFIEQMLQIHSIVKCIVCTQIRMLFSRLTVYSYHRDVVRNMITPHHTQGWHTSMEAKENIHDKLNA